MALFEIKVKGKSGFINKHGDLVIQPQFEKALKFSDGLAFASVKVDNKELAGFINESGEWVIEPVYSGLPLYNMFPSVYFSQGYAPVKLPDNKKKFFIDKNGDPITDPIYENAFPFSESRALVKRNGLYGYIDLLGKEITPCQFGEPPLDPMDCRFSEGLALARFGNEDEGNLHYIDSQGKAVIEGPFIKANPFSEGFAMVTGEGDFGEYYFINKEGEIPFEQVSLQSTSFSEGLAGVYDPEMECIGFISSSGDWVIKPQFEYALWFSEGLSLVQHFGSKKKGFINPQGELIIKHIDIALPFCNGLAYVHKNKQKGYINTKGEFVWTE
ncbi:WG repeat-containing protein [Cytophagaceae bacterium ABcell3]|nr:WG repeat-containing protein [Cytophagaceae bacterium ABcell3]